MRPSDDGSAVDAPADTTAWLLQQGAERLARSREILAELDARLQARGSTSLDSSTTDEDARTA